MPEDLRYGVDNREGMLWEKQCCLDSIVLVHNVDEIQIVGGEGVLLQNCEGRISVVVVHIYLC